MDRGITFQVADVTLTTKDAIPALDAQEMWIPLSASDLDRCTELLDKFDPDVDEGHPGFTDREYRKRRCTIAEIAQKYRAKDDIPRVDYTEQEHEAWSKVYRRVREIAEKRACSEYLHNLRLLEEAGVFTEAAIPQLQDVSAFLKRSSGFTLRPVAGLLSSRDFLASLAFRVFQCTQYIRHHSRPEYSPEPDCVHEMIGHVPMFLDPVFATFSQQIGLASLGASDDDIKRLSGVFWFTVEFGLCQEKEEVKAYGAGLMSSFGEMENAFSDSVELRPFDPEDAATLEYSDQDYQPIYFVAGCLEDMQQKFWAFASSLEKSCEIRYDASTNTVAVVLLSKSLGRFSSRIDSEVEFTGLQDSNILSERVH